MGYRPRSAESGGPGVTAHCDLTGRDASGEHPIAAVSGLQTALDGKAGSGHAHAGVYEPAGAVSAHEATADPHTGYQREAEKGQASGYASLDAGGKVPSAQLPSVDPWTVLKLANDFTTSSGTAVDVTGLGFTPAPNTDYMFEAVLYLRTASATVNPRPGLAWPTGMTDGVATVEESQSATAQILAMGNVNAAILAAVGGIPNTTQSWPALVYGAAKAGASPSGQVRIQVASETAGTNVTVKAGSYFRFRSY
jgi:hypothetical protein